METIFPQDPGLSGLFLVGFRKAPIGGATQRVGTVVVRRSYSLAGETLLPDPSGEVIRIADQVALTTIDGTSDVPIVERESDLAPYKAEADLIVLGYHASGETAEARVGGQLWLRRVAGSDNPDDPDTVDNLFGWSQRIFAPRVDEAGSFSTDPADYPAQWPVPAGSPNRDPLHAAGFVNRFYNAYRRDFKQLAGDFPYLSAGQAVSLTRSDPGGTQTLDLTVPGEVLSARFEHYCGYGPDRDTRWCARPVPLARDTLVLEPDAGRAYLLWRGVWDYDGLPEDAYRRLTVTLEE